MPMLTRFPKKSLGQPYKIYVPYHPSERSGASQARRAKESTLNMTETRTKEVLDTKAFVQYKRDIQTLILANFTREEISESLGIELNVTTRVTNKVLEAVKKEGIDLTKSTSASVRKLLLLSSVHDVLSGLLLGELFKTKRALQAPPVVTPTPRTRAKQGGKSATTALKPPTEAMLYNRLGLLSDQIRKNNKAYFDVVGPMGVAGVAPPLQTKGPPCPSTNNILGDLSELEAYDELERSAKRQLAFVKRRKAEIAGSVELPADVEVLDE